MSHSAVLGSYVDDGFGGDSTLDKAQVMIDWIYKIGRATSATFNRKKTKGPATRLVILGLLYCSVTQSCRVGDKKREKYLARVNQILQTSSTTSKVLEKVVGNLGYAA